MSTLVRAWCDCGWHGEYSSVGRAGAARRRHSCERHRALRAAARRGAARRANVAQTRVERPCLHPEARHEHGSREAYVHDRCRCRACTDANVSYYHSLERARAYGRTNTCDAEPVRRHVRELLAAGIGTRTIAARAGVSRTSLTKLLHGQPGKEPSARVRRSTAERLMALRPTIEAAAESALVDITGPARRAQALVAIGWSVPKIAATAGLNRQAIDPLLNDARGTLTARNARAILATYDRLWATEPPEATPSEQAAAERARRRADAAGWVPPLAWDDDTIDDPSALPAPGYRGPQHGECRERGCEAPHAAATSTCALHDDNAGKAEDRGVDLDEWLFLVRAGEDLERAAKRLGVRLTQIEYRASKDHHDAVLAVLAAARRERREARSHVVPTTTFGARRRRAA